MSFGRVALAALCMSCSSSLSAYDRSTNGGGGPGTETGTSTTPTDTTGPATTAGGTTSGSATGSATGTNTGGGTTAGTTTGTTSGGATSGGATSGGTTSGGTTSGGTTTGTTTGATLPLASLKDGTYEGWITIDYELLIPFFGGTSICDGDIAITVDQYATPPITGTISNCEWPVLDLWAAIWLNDANGILDGTNPTYGLVSGQTEGSESVGTFVWDDPWSGVVTTGPVISGAFSGGNFLYDTYSGVFSASYIGP